MNPQKPLATLFSSIFSISFSNSQPCSLIHKSIYYRSYWKSLKKRRRIKTKKRPISDKRLKQEREQGFSYANQIKILDIKKQLDKKNSVNHQIYELVEDLYFPDIRKQSYESAQVSIKDRIIKVTDQETDLITRQLQSKTLVTQLLQVFLKFEKGIIKQQDQFQRIQKKYSIENSQDNQQSQGSQENEMANSINESNNFRFQLQHYETLVIKMCKYLKGLPGIRQKYMNRYESIVSQVKDAQRGVTKKKAKIRCPYQFLDAQDLSRYKPWQQFIRSFTACIKQYKYVEEQRVQPLNYESYDKNKEVQLKTQMIRHLLRQVRTMLSIQWNMKQIPESLHSAVLQKIIDFDSQQIFQLQSLKGQQLNLLLRPFTINNFVRLQEQIVIPDPISNEAVRLNAAHFVHSIILEFVRKPQKLSTNCLNSIISFNHTSDRQLYLTPYILHHLKPLILRNISNISFQKSVANFDNYSQIGTSYATHHQQVKTNGNPGYLQFMQLLLFDLIRKAYSCKNHKYLLKVLSWINQRKISLSSPNKQQKQIEGVTLLNKIGQVVPLFYVPSKVSQTVQLVQFLNPKQIYLVLECYFRNRVSGNSWIAQLQLLANQVVKQIKEYSLQNLTDICIMLRLLSIGTEQQKMQSVALSFRVLSQLTAQRFLKEYHQKIQQYRSQRLYLLPDSTLINKQRLRNGDIQEMSQRQVNLQECRLAVLWNYVIALLQDNRLDAKVDALIALFPSSSEDIFSFKDPKTKSMYLKKYYQPMILQMLHQVHYFLMPYGLFPKPPLINSRMINRNCQISKNTLNIQQQIAVRKWQKYYEPEFLKSKIRRLFQEQAKETRVFIKGFNTVQGIYIPERWSTGNRVLREIMSKDRGKNQVKQGYYDLKQYERWLIENYRELNGDKTRSFFESEFYEQLSNISLSGQFLSRRQTFVKEYLGVQSKQSQKREQSPQSSQKKRYRYYQLY